VWAFAWLYETCDRSAKECESVRNLTNVQLSFVLKILDWRQSRAEWVDALERTTGRSLASWNQRIGTLDFKDEKSLRAWLGQEGVTGYPQMLLVMEQFGYPDYMRASASRLIRTQYADRQHLRPVYDAIIEAVLAFGNVTVQGSVVGGSCYVGRRRRNLSCVGNG
jgi:hypothetical protein